jgi:hypothetical protein
MIGRLFFIIAGIISFSCILFFGFQLTQNQHAISAELIFNQNDGKILIVNKLNETNPTNISFSFPKNESQLIQKLFSISHNSERIYVSSLRNRIVIETQSNWTKTLIQRYFTRKKIIFKSNENNFILENGFIATYSKNLLIIGKEIISLEHWQKFTFPTWDKMASCNIINISNVLYSQDIYCAGNTTTTFQSNFKKIKNNQKINDFELFASILPKGISNYHFLSKNYALSNGYLKKQDLLYKWCDKGYVTFDIDGSKVLISDFKLTTDPFELLNEETEEEEMVTGSKSEYDGIKISNKFPQIATGSIFIKYLEDKVVISENEAAVNQVLAYYETGRTVALSEKAKKSIYENLPSDVCERYIQDGEKFTKSVSTNKLITVRKSQIFITSDIKGTVTEKENIYTLDLTQNVSHIVTSNLLQICFTENSFFGIQNGKKLWEKAYQGSIIGTPVCQDLLNDGNSQIFFTTNRKIYLIDSKGNNYIGFPISLNQAPSSEAVFFDGKKGKQLIFVNTNNEVIKYNGKGKRLKSIKLSISPNKIAPFIFKNGKENFAVISGKNGGQLLQLDNLSKQNTFPTLNDKILFCSTETTPAFFYPEGGKLIRNDFTGKISTSGSYHKIELLQSLKGNTRNLISFLTDKNFHICDGAGKVIRTVALPSSNISFYQVLTLEDGSSIVGFLDTIENAIYLYTAQGKKINHTELEGQDLFCLSETPNGILVTTKGKNLIIQYKLDNK